MRRFLLWVIMGSELLIHNTVKAQNALWQFSLMHTPHECQTVQDSRQTQDNILPKKMSATSELHLGGIAYIDQDHWTVWINDQYIDPIRSHHDIDIVQVSPTGVHFRLKDQNRSAVVEIQLNQTLDLNLIRYASDHNVNRIKIKKSG